LALSVVLLRELADAEFAHRTTDHPMARTYRADRRLPLVVEKPQGGFMT
jgi:hypothetical protein